MLLPDVACWIFFHDNVSCCMCLQNIVAIIDSLFMPLVPNFEISKWLSVCCGMLMHDVVC